MHEDELLAILDDWNFWQKDLETGIRRTFYLNILERETPSEQIKVITGARRSGKSYIMRQFARWLIEKKGINKNNILMVNFEDPRFTDLGTRLLEQIFDLYRETYKPGRDPMFFWTRRKKFHGGKNG